MRAKGGARVAVGAGLALAVVVAAGFAVVAVTRPQQRPQQGGQKPAPAGLNHIPGTADDRQLTTGVSTSWPSVKLTDTGPADWTYNPAGWDSVQIPNDFVLPGGAK